MATPFFKYDAKFKIIQATLMLTQYAQNLVSTSSLSEKTYKVTIIWSEKQDFFKFGLGSCSIVCNC